MANNCFTTIGNLWLNWFIKYLARPFRKFFNSTKIKLAGTEVIQHSSFPLPLPILTPLGFRVKGKCGKTCNQTNRCVFSPFFEAFLKNNLNLEICLPVNCKGCRVRSPELPNRNEVLNFVVTKHVRFFCFFLYLKCFGCKSSHTLSN